MPATPQAVVTAVPVDNMDTGSTEALNHDVEYARGVMTENIDLVREATKSAILLAQSGDSPRAYEVVASMLTAIVNANKELVALHRAKEDTTPLLGRGSPRHHRATVEVSILREQSSSDALPICYASCGVSLSRRISNSHYAQKCVQQ